MASKHDNIGRTLHAGTIIHTPFTGSTAIDADTARIQPGAAFRLLRVEIHLDSTPASQAEDFTITLDAGDGDDYDVNLFTQDLYTTAVQDLVVIFGKGWEYESDDEIDIAWTNTPGETYGLRIVYEFV